MPVQAEDHIPVHLLPVGEHHVVGQVVAAGSVWQEIGLLPGGQFLRPVQVGDQAVIAAAPAVIIDPAVGCVRHGERIGIDTVLVAGEVLPPDAVLLRPFPVELVGHLAGGEGRFVCDGCTGDGCLAVILQIVAVFHDAGVAVGADDGRGGGEVASWPAGCSLEPAGDIAVLDQTVVDKGDAAHQILAALAQRQCADTAVLDNAIALVLIDDAADVLLTGPVQRLAALDGAVVGVRNGAGLAGVTVPVQVIDGQVLYGAAAGDAAEESGVLSSDAHPKGDRMAVSVKDTGVALDRCPRIVLTAGNIVQQHGVQAALAAVHPLAEGFQIVRAGDLIDLLGRCRAGFGLYGGILADGVDIANLDTVLRFLRFGTYRLRQRRCGQQRQAQDQHKKQACDTFSHVCILL